MAAPEDVKITRPLLLRNSGIAALTYGQGQ